MTPRHPCTFTDDELQRLPSVARLPPGQEPDLLHYVSGGVTWVVGRSGPLWARCPADPDDPVL